MYLDIELDKRELAVLEKGGYLSFVVNNGIRIIVKKDSDETEKEKNREKGEHE